MSDAERNIIAAHQPPQERLSKEEAAIVLEAHCLKQARGGPVHIREPLTDIMIECERARFDQKNTAEEFDGLR